MTDYLPRFAASGAHDLIAGSLASSYAGVVSFLAVVDAGSFARAGDRLGIGRSSVSRNVQKLEAQLDTRLFLRTKRSMSLTSEGQFLYDCVESAVFFCLMGECSPMTRAWIWGRRVFP